MNMDYVAMQQNQQHFPSCPVHTSESHGSAQAHVGTWHYRPVPADRQDDEKLNKNKGRKKRQKKARGLRPALQSTKEK
jgi:hypothetical protein